MLIFLSHLLQLACTSRLKQSTGAAHALFSPRDVTHTFRPESDHILGLRRLRCWYLPQFGTSVVADSYFSAVKPKPHNQHKHTQPTVGVWMLTSSFPRLAREEEASAGPSCQPEPFDIGFSAEWRGRSCWGPQRHSHLVYWKKRETHPGGSPGQAAEAFSFCFSVFQEVGDWAACVQMNQQVGFIPRSACGN